MYHIINKPISLEYSLNYAISTTKRRWQLKKKRFLKICAIISGIPLLSFFSFPSYAVTSNLEVEILSVGTGDIANEGHRVDVHYTGKLADGSVFDSSITRGKPFTFTIGKGQVIQGWEKGISGMRVGEKRRLTIPPELGYGSRGAGASIPPNATLIFEVELLKVSVVPTLAQFDQLGLLAAQKDGTTIIDIRREEEWRETGIIKGAHTITAFTKDGRLHPEFQNKFFSLIPTKSVPVLLYCRTGNRTGSLGNALIDQVGLTKVGHLTEGIVGWKSGGMPVVEYQK